MNSIERALPDLPGSIIEDTSAAELTLSRLEYRRAALRRRLQPVGEHMYSCTSGNLYAARSYSSSIKASGLVAIYVALSDDPVEMRVSRKRHTIKAAVVMPMTTRAVMHHGAGFVCAMLNPTHLNYRQICTASLANMKELDRKKFEPLNDRLHEACSGSLDVLSSRTLLEQIVAIAAQDLPAVTPLDPRVAATIERLRDDVNRPLEVLAADVGLSGFRLSQLFSKCIGLSLRSYQSWQKTDSR